MDLFQNKFVAQRGLVEVLGNCVAWSRTMEGFPVICIREGFSVSVNSNRSIGSRGRSRRRNLIVCSVRKQCEIRITSAGSQRAKAGDKHPVIAGSNQRHEKLRHQMSIRNLKVSFSIHLNGVSGY